MAQLRLEQQREYLLPFELLRARVYTRLTVGMSAKFVAGALLSNRYGIEFPADAVEVLRPEILDLCRQLHLPEAALPEVRELLRSYDADYFGTAEEADGAIGYRLYFGFEASRPLCHAIDWAPDKGTFVRREYQRSTFSRQAARDKIRASLASPEPGPNEARALHRALEGQVLEVLARSKLGGRFSAYEVQEQSGRRSLDIFVSDASGESDASMRMAAIREPIAAIAALLSVPDADHQAWYRSVAHGYLGRVAVGRNRRGEPFVTVYGPLRAEPVYTPSRAYAQSAATPSVPASSKPANPKPASLKPANSRPASLKPANARPASSKPASLTIDGIAALWARTTGRPEICVAVLDGPVDLTQPIFVSGQLRELRPPDGVASVAGPAGRHGTAIASVVFASHDSDIRGLAPGCRGLSVPIFSDHEDQAMALCSQLDLARAITAALEHGAHIINISGGQLSESGEPEPLLRGALERCHESGVLVIAAAGNDACACVHVPASDATVLAVGAMDSFGSPLQASNWGDAYRHRGIVAPGEAIPVATPDGGTDTMSGTSVAAAVVSGVAGLLLSLQVEHGLAVDPVAVGRALLESAHPCYPEGSIACQRALAGSLNLRGALQLLIGDTLHSTDSKHINTRPSSYRETETAADMNDEHPPPQTETSDVAPAGAPSAAPSVTASTLPESQPARAPAAAGVGPSECATCAASGVSLVYALGTLDYDFGTESRRSSIAQSMSGGQNPSDPAQLLAHLQENPHDAEAVTWVLKIDQTPIYALTPISGHAHIAYQRIVEFYRDQIEGKVHMVSMPGRSDGVGITLASGQSVPRLSPEIRGMYSWTTEALVEHVCGPEPKNAAAKEEHAKKRERVWNFLERVYYELRNLGLTSRDRALNYAATNAYRVEQAYEKALSEGMELAGIDVEHSPVASPGTDCWDVKLSFFHPKNRYERAREEYRFTVDVSDVVPVLVGPARRWSVY